MRFDSATGWFDGVTRIDSPNFDARPDSPAGPCAPALIIIHGISLPPGEYGGDAVAALFTNRLDPSAHPYFAEIAHLKVSTHLFLRRSGEIVQFVSLFDRAWHAGESAFEGRPACNDFSVGIEVEGTDEDPYAPAQFDRLVELTAAVMQALDIPDPERVVGHVDVAPQRKTDPGPNFAWGPFRAALAERVRASGDWLA